MILYFTTPTLSLEAFHVNEIDDDVLAVLLRPVGFVGGLPSARTTRGDDLADRLPARSVARTW